MKPLHDGESLEKQAALPGVKAQSKKDEGGLSTKRWLRIFAGKNSKLHEFQFWYANRGKVFHRHRGTQLRLPRFISVRTVIKLRLEMENVGCSNFEKKNHLFFCSLGFIFFLTYSNKRSHGFKSGESL